MRRFADRLRRAGHRVLYLAIDDPRNRQSIAENLLELIRKFQIQRFEYQLPDDWRLDEELALFCRRLNVETRAYDAEHFLTTRDELARFFAGKKRLLMESFYRHMRKEHSILLDAKGGPEGGRWNFDEANRKPLPKNSKVPAPWQKKHDVRPILEKISQAGVRTIGRPRSEFLLPIDRKEALEQLEHFIRNLLPHFGDYQDAICDAEPFLFHSRLSFALNLKMIDPKEVVEAVVEAYRQDPSRYRINQVEGFVRQVIGWREYMRGIYWKEMPAYEQTNHFGHTRRLPSFYWNAETRMNCLRNAIRNSLDNAYAHHIQRLMVTGNFALLNLTHPAEVDEWYWGIYADAVEWVELPNTHGMSQYADGGLVSTKPYVSSASYIRKMSDYCDECFYDPKEKTGARLPVQFALLELPRSPPRSARAESTDEDDLQDLGSVR